MSPSNSYIEAPIVTTFEDRTFKGGNEGDLNRPPQIYHRVNKAHRSQFRVMAK